MLVRYQVHAFTNRLLWGYGDNLLGLPVQDKGISK